MILAGDLGGTKANLGLFDVKAGKLARVANKRYATADHSSLEEVVTDFLERRITTVTRTFADTGRHLHRMHEPHPEHADIEVDGHFHVVGIQREVVHAVISQRAGGRGLVVGGKLDVVHVR